MDQNLVGVSKPSRPGPLVQEIPDIATTVDVTFTSRVTYAEDGVESRVEPHDE